MLQKNSHVRTTLTTRKGAAHFDLRIKRVDGDVSFFEGLVNGTELVSGVSDGKQSILYFTLRGVNFLYQSNPTPRIYSRASLPQTCGVETSGARQSQVTSHANLIKASGQSNKISLSILVDKSGIRKIGSGLTTKVKAIVSRMDQIYRAQLSISISLNQIIQMKSDFQVSDIESLLNTLQRKRGQLGIRSSADAVHLITGRSLDSSSGVIGLAYLGTACRYDGKYRFGVNIYQSKSFQPTLIAHELGHNFNATHVSSGIMQAVLSGPFSTFASTSKNEIGSYVSQYGSCLH